MDQHQTLINWLNNAYAMEISIKETLENQLGSAKDYPDVTRLLEEHIDQTASQAERIKNEITRLGGKISSVKSTFSKVMGEVQGALPAAADDAVIKNLIADHATEHFEHATYIALITAAQHLGEDETAQVCNEIMQEELVTSEKTKELLEKTTRQYLEM